MMELTEYISKWIKNYAEKNNIKTLVIGISGGIDSSVVSTLSAMTGIDTIAVSLPIRQKPEQNDLSMRHGAWLQDTYKNVQHITVNLDEVFSSFENLFSGKEDQLAFANSRSRLRMTTLYQIAQTSNGIVVGTGNKVEDFGIGFYTKYGDGGVDISPIADCMKTEVWEMGRKLGILQEIIDAEPTDGLWDDHRTDEQQIGMSYENLEIAMRLAEDYSFTNETLTSEEKELVQKYDEIRKKNLHKMNPIPICYVN